MHAFALSTLLPLLAFLTTSVHAQTVIDGHTVVQTQELPYPTTLYKVQRTTTNLGLEARSEVAIQTADSLVPRENPEEKPRVTLKSESSLVEPSQRVDGENEKRDGAVITDTSTVPPRTTEPATVLPPAKRGEVAITDTSTVELTVEPTPLPPAVKREEGVVQTWVGSGPWPVGPTITVV